MKMETKDKNDIEGAVKNQEHFRRIQPDRPVWRSIHIVESFFESKKFEFGQTKLLISGRPLNFGAMGNVTRKN